MARDEGCREVLLSFWTVTFPEGIGWHTQIRQFDGTLIDCTEVEAGWREPTGNNADSWGRNSRAPYLSWA